MSGKIEVLTDGKPIVPDFKVALDADSEHEYLWDLISDINKVEGNPTNIWVKLGDDNKIKMYRKTEQYTPNDFVINTDSFAVTEANGELTLPAYRPDNNNTFTYFPINLPSGKISNISILGWGGSTLTTGFIAIYGSDKPTINGAKLLYALEGAEFINNAIVLHTQPEIPAKNPDGTKNSFLFCVFFSAGETDGGYRILSKLNVNLGLLAQVNYDGAVNCIGQFTSRLTGFKFNQVFDYNTTNDADTINSIRVPYINFTSIVEA